MKSFLIWRNLINENHQMKNTTLLSFITNRVINRFTLFFLIPLTSSSNP